MKKTLVIILVCAFVFSVSLTSGIAASATDSLSAGTVIKGEGLSTLYYIGEDGRRYVFPNSNIFFSWYDDFSEVVEVPLETLYEYPLGGNARYKPGALLVKIQTDPKVYAVGHNGKLHWIKTEKIARALYGNNWNKLVDDVADSFFTNYEVGDEVNTDEDFDPIAKGNETPSISHNRGFKAKVATRNRNQNEKMCGQLEGALSRLQKRLERWGAELTDASSDLLEKCYIPNDAPNFEKKMTLCHKGKTVTIGIPAHIRTYINQGGTLGACAATDETNGNQDDADSNDTDNGDDTDNTDLSIDEISITEITYSSAIFVITTSKNASTTVKYDIKEINDTSAYESATSTDDNFPYSIELSGLLATTTYYYLVEATDSDNNIATSSGNFKTKDEPVTE